MGGRSSPWPTVHGTVLMAVVNVNADSFSDPRDRVDLDERVVRARDAVADGAGIVDLGIFLRQQQDLLVVCHRGFERENRFFATDKQRDDHVWINHDIAQRKNGN